MLNIVCCFIIWVEEKNRFTYELQSCILQISQMSKINFKIRCTTECYWHVRVLKKHINVKKMNGMFDGKISYCTNYNKPQ